MDVLCPTSTPPPAISLSLPGGIGKHSSCLTVSHLSPPIEGESWAPSGEGAKWVRPTDQQTNRPTGEGIKALVTTAWETPQSITGDGGGGHAEHRQGEVAKWLRPTDQQTNEGGDQSTGHDHLGDASKHHRGWEGGARRAPSRGGPASGRRSPPRGSGARRRQSQFRNSWERSRKLKVE